MLTPYANTLFVSFANPTKQNGGPKPDRRTSRALAANAVALQNRLIPRHVFALHIIEELTA